MNKTNPITKIVYTGKHKIELILLNKYEHWQPLKRWNLKTGVREL